MDLHPDKNYILGYHPHGIMSAGAFATFGTDTCRFTEVFPGIKPTLAVLAGLFMIPVFREYIMSGGTSPYSLIHLIKKKKKKENFSKMNVTLIRFMPSE